MKRTPILGVTVGAVIGGRYQIEKLLGVGGFGHVYQAIQMPLGRRVAVKLLATYRPEVSARFAREAALAQRLEHPHTVRILDFGATAEGAPFIVFELLRGKSVAELCAEKGAMPLGVALDITSQILKSLMEAHALGIVHRDIKPANVMVTSHSGEPFFVKVLDFGIAKDLYALDTGSPRAVTHGADGAHANPGLTSGSELMGTPRYMAPEQALGDAAGPETDVYAVGLLLAEMLRGRPVFDQLDGLMIANEQASSRPVPLAELEHGPAGAVLLRATQKERARRYPSAAAMLADVEKLRGAADRSAPIALVDDQRVTSAITTDPTQWTPSVAPLADHKTVPQTPPPTRRKLWIGLLGIAGVLTAGAIGWFVATSQLEPPLERRSAREDDSEEEEEEEEELRNPKVPPPPDVDWSKRTVPESVDVLRARMKDSGYQFYDGDIIDMAGFSQWTWTATKRPCGGTVLFLVYGDPSTAETSERVMRNQGARVLRTKNRVLYVQLLRQNGPQTDPACSDPLADRLTR